jgi:RNA polymerase sigma factor (sigma-70 family)
MSTEPTVIRWLKGIQRGDSEAAESLWECCFPELVRFARGRLRNVPCRAADEEDVALSAMRSFYGAVAQGRFDHLSDRDELFRLLLGMTARKAIDFIRRETCRRRGGGKVQGDSALRDGGSESSDSPLADTSCTPELAIIVCEEVRRMLDLLPDAKLQELAVAKMEGCTNEEIAQRLQCSERTVERRLHMIREIWQGEALT